MYNNNHGTPEAPSVATILGFIAVFIATLILCLIYRHAGG